MRKFIIETFILLFLSMSVPLAESVSVSSTEQIAKAYSLFIQAKGFELDGDLRQAEKLYNEVLALDPGAINAYLKIAEIKASERDFKKAVEIIEKANSIQESHEAFRTLGRIYWTMSRMKEAEKNYSRAMESAPEDEHFYLEYTRFLLDADKPSEALAILKKLEAESSLSDTAFLFLAEVYSKLDDAVNEEASLKSAVRSNPQNYDALLMLAQIYEERSDLEEAAESYESALKVTGSRDIGIKRKLGIVSYKLGNYRKAADLLSDVMYFDQGNVQTIKTLADSLRNTGNYKDADVYYLELIGKDPSDIDFRYAYGESLYRQRKYDEAVVQFDIVLKKLKSFKTGSEIAEQFMKDLRLKRAMVIFDGGDKNRAVSIVREIIKNEDIPSVDSFVVLLSMYISSERFDEAIEALNEAFIHRPGNIKLRLMQIDIMELTGKIEKASALVEQLLENDELSSEIYSVCASFYIRNGLFGKAADILVKASAVYPDHEGLLFQLGAAHERNGNIVESMNAFEQVLKIDPGSAQAMNYLGYMMIENGTDMGRAMELIENAVEIDGENPAYLDSLGWAYFKTGGDLMKARKLLEKAVEIDEDPVIWDHLGDIYLELGLEKAALKSWKKALEMEIENGEKVRKKILAIE